MLLELNDQGRIDVRIWHALGREILIRHGVEAELATVVTDVLVEADKRGVVTHGLTRLPSYVARVHKGLLDPNARPEIVKDGQTLVLLDGHNGFGAVAAVDAVELATDRARDHGMCWVSVRNSNHFGMAGYYSHRLAQRGLVGIVITNASPAVAAYGGKRATLGTNPLSIAAPAQGEPIVLDMATTTVARGKIRRAKAEGKTLPPGLALDIDGNPTTDPETALKGTLASLGGPKGYGLAVMIDLLSGVVAGGSILTELRQATDLSGKAGTCFTIVAADIGRISDHEEYVTRIEEFRSLIKQSGEPGAKIYLPGEIESERAAKAEADGIDVPNDVLESLKTLLS
ncbi:MAG: Ldh family oxidoreductase [Nitrospira sp.]|nr:Ldh family oxidoreductase [Nitrospira sp.]